MSKDKNQQSPILRAALALQKYKNELRDTRYPTVLQANTKSTNAFFHAASQTELLHFLETHPTMETKETYDKLVAIYNMCAQISRDGRKVDLLNNIDPEIISYGKTLVMCAKERFKCILNSEKSRETARGLRELEAISKSFADQVFKHSQLIFPTGSVIDTAHGIPAKEIQYIPKWNRKETIETLTIIEQVLQQHLIESSASGVVSSPDAELDMSILTPGDTQARLPLVREPLLTLALSRTFTKNFNRKRFLPPSIKAESSNKAKETTSYERNFIPPNLAGDCSSNAQAAMAVLTYGKEMNFTRRQRLLGELLDLVHDKESERLVPTHSNHRLCWNSHIMYQAGTRIQDTLDKFFQDRDDYNILVASAKTGKDVMAPDHEDKPENIRSHLLPTKGSSFSSNALHATTQFQSMFSRLGSSFTSKGTPEDETKRKVETKQNRQASFAPPIMVGRGT